MSNLSAIDVDIRDKVERIIQQQLGVNKEQITQEASFSADLKADSLDTVELIMALEEEFGMEVPEADAEKLQTVGDVMLYIQQKRKEA